MTMIGSEIIKIINILKHDTVINDINNLNVVVLKKLLEKYFQILIPISTLEAPLPDITHSLSEFQHLQDLNTLKLDLANFIECCICPNNHEELLKIIVIAEELSNVNKDDIIVLERKYKRKFTNVDLEFLMSKNLDRMGDEATLFTPINEMLKMRLDSKQIYQSIKEYYKNPQQDKRTLTAKLMMLLSEESSSIYYIDDVDVSEIIKLSAPPIESAIPPLTVTPILSEVAKSVTPPLELESSKIAKPPVSMYFSSSLHAVQPTGPNLSPVLSPKYSAIKKYAANI